MFGKSQAIIFFQIILLCAEPLLAAPQPFFPPRVLRISADADFEFYLASGSDESAVASRIESILDSAGEVYLKQIGIELKLVKLNVFTSATQPYTSSDHETLLNQFKTHTLKKAGSSSADAYHLFSGKNIQATGFALLNAVCKSPERSFSLSRPPSAGQHWQVFAHELAHTFGATHDPAPGFLMSLVVSPAAVKFSDFSLGEIFAHLNSSRNCLKKSRNYGFALKVRARGKKSIRFTASFEQPDGKSGCRAKLYAATKKQKLTGITPDFQGALLIADKLLSSTRFEFQRSIKSKKKIARKKAPLYFRAKTLCGAKSSFSLLRKIKVSRKKRFLKLLANSS